MPAHIFPPLIRYLGPSKPPKITPAHLLNECLRMTLAAERAYHEPRRAYLRGLVEDALRGVDTLAPSPYGDNRP